MDFEHNAVESDYDEEYDSKVIVMSRGQAHAYNTQEEEDVKRNPKNEIRESVMEYKPDENTRRRGPVQLPRMRHEEHREEETVENKAENVFPKGGWKVQKIEHVGISELNKVVATLSKKESVATPRQRSPGSRNFKWKNITNEILSECDTQENTKEDFVDVKPKTRSLPKIETHVPTEVKNQEEDDRRKNTKFCRFVEIKSVNGKVTEVNKCRSSTCSYAHSIEVYNPPSCRFQDGCRNMATCSFKHKSETKESYHERSSRLARSQKL